MADIVRLKAPGGAEQLELAQIELPPPVTGEIRLRQTAIGVNFIDVYQRLGLYGLPEAKIPGVEGVGVISAVGADVKGLKVGVPRVQFGAETIQFGCDLHFAQSEDSVNNPSDPARPSRDKRSSQHPARVRPKIDSGRD